MISQHTPGPWTQHEGEVRAKNYGLISRSYYGKPDGEGAANARLIAAAPDLLEALKWVVRICDEGGYPDGKCLQEARTAIAKATGETK